MNISTVIPVFNEKDSLPELVNELNDNLIQYENSLKIQFSQNFEIHRNAYKITKNPLHDFDFIQEF